MSLGLISSFVECDSAREFVNDVVWPLSPTREESDLGDEIATRRIEGDGGQMPSSQAGKYRRVDHVDLPMFSMRLAIHTRIGRVCIDA